MGGFQKVETVTHVLCPSERKTAHEQPKRCYQGLVAIALLHGSSNSPKRTQEIAWDIIAPKPGAGEKSFRERESLPAYEGIREGWVMAA